MSTIQLHLEDELVRLLSETDRPLDRTVREMLVLELYRRGTLSSGKAAEFLGMKRIEFIQHASRLGIPYFDLTEEEWESERAASRTL